MLGNTFFAFIAGTLTVLAPCVIPLLPIVLGTAASKHRLGPIALASGLALAFVAVGLFVATIGFSIGLDADRFRLFGGVLLVAFGVVLLMPALQLRFATAAGPLGNWVEQRFGGVQGDGLTGQFATGLLLGAVWAPCVGPTLGAASVLAAQGQNLGQVTLTMSAFGIGAALPLLLLGYLSREVLIHWRDKLLGTGRTGKMFLGGALLIVGLLIISGLDKQLETVLVNASPAWLTNLTTRF